MGRLTYRDNNGKGYVKNQGYYNGVYAQLEIVAERLTAYKDTGLEPKQVKALGTKMKQIYSGTAEDIILDMKLLADHMECEKYRALGPIEELSALVQARDDGLVVALQGDYTEADGEEALRTAMYRCGVANNPVTRYTADAIAEKLTRAEAEAGIGGGQT